MLLYISFPRLKYNFKLNWASEMQNDKNQLQETGVVVTRVLKASVIFLQTLSQFFRVNHKQLET